MIYDDTRSHKKKNPNANQIIILYIIFIFTFIMSLGTLLLPRKNVETGQIFVAMIFAPLSIIAICLFSIVQYLVKRFERAGNAGVRVNSAEFYIGIGCTKRVYELIDIDNVKFDKYLDKFFIFFKSPLKYDRKESPLQKITKWWWKLYKSYHFYPLYIVTNPRELMKVLNYYGIQVYSRGFKEHRKSKISHTR